MKVVLTIIDTVGIQDYIFGSNRLRENIGASYLVEQATRGWVYEELNKLFPGKHNIADLKSGKIDHSKRMEDGLTAELIYAGGGNTTILFRCPDEGDPKLHAKEFAWNLSQHILREAPGLEIVIAHSDEPFDWNTGAMDLPGEVKKLREGRLAHKKRTRQATLTPLLGLGVTAECASTGLVAEQSSRGLEPEVRLVSRAIIAKMQKRKNAQARLRRIVHEADPNREFSFSDELDHLGRIGGEESYIAVVHIDGNEMGKLFGECGGRATNNRDYIEKISRFSEGVDQSSRQSIIAMFRKLRFCIETPAQKPKGEKPAWTVKEALQGKLKHGQRKQFDLFLKTQAGEVLDNEEDEDGEDDAAEGNRNEKPCWPILPLVYGGDDVTFVCNGQLGLSLAKIYMEEFTRQTARLCGVAIHTGAGICLVKVHYPFRRAYQLSETLTKSAKGFLGDEEQKRKFSALDWHISATGLGGDLRSIREREYKVSEGLLTMRPVWLQHDSDWRTFGNLNRLLALFNYHEAWAGRRNKLKSLREALRGGSERVMEFLQLSGVKLPVLNQSQGDLHEKGWAGDQDGQRHCGYFDALEVLDHHLLLEEVTNGNDD